MESGIGESNYLSQLIGSALGLPSAQAVQPRLAARFEPAPAAQVIEAVAWREAPHAMPQTEERITQRAPATEGESVTKAMPPTRESASPRPVAMRDEVTRADAPTAAAAAVLAQAPTAVLARVEHIETIRVRDAAPQVQADAHAQAQRSAHDAGQHKVAPHLRLIEAQSTAQPVIHLQQQRALNANDAAASVTEPEPRTAADAPVPPSAQIVIKPNTHAPTPGFAPQPFVDGFAPEPTVTAPAPPPAPVIRVTIGKVEIRATQAQAAPRKPNTSARTMSLDDYLQQRHRQRDGGQR